MASMRVIGGGHALFSARDRSAVGGVGVRAGRAVLDLIHGASPGDRLGTLGQQVRRRIGIQEVEHRLDRLHRRVEVQVHFLVHVAAFDPGASSSSLHGVDQVLAQAQHRLALPGILHFSVVAVAASSAVVWSDRR
jgi:hypothetical protein